MPSPWTQRLSNEHNAQPCVDQTLGDRIAADNRLREEVLKSSERQYSFDYGNDSGERDFIFVSAS